MFSDIRKLVNSGSSLRNNLPEHPIQVVQVNHIALICREPSFQVFPLRGNLKMRMEVQKRHTAISPYPVRD